MIRSIAFFSLLFVCHFLAAQNETKPFQLGVTEEIYSQTLSEKRLLNIYLPDRYAEDTVAYPVIYLLDGSSQEDFIHISGLVQFFTMMEMMPKTIVVGIANVDRKRDYTFPTTIEEDKKSFPTTGKSEFFISFLEKEVLPFVKQKYRTNDSRILIGQSLGGLVATEILLKKPELFNTYFIVSPSLWWDNESLLAKLPELYQSHTYQKTKVFVSVGNEGRRMEQDAKKLAKKLKAQKDQNVTVHFYTLPKENHGTILHRSIYHALEMLYPKK